jgi:phosphohistidine phosphatase SixA
MASRADARRLYGNFLSGLRVNAHPNRIKRNTMMSFSRLAGACALFPFFLLVLLAPVAALAEPSMIYLVRHGEKLAEGKDPDLSPQGRQRAQNIAAMLSKAGIAHIFSTPTNRTRQTAQPLAQASGLTVQEYDPRAPKALVEKVKVLNGPVLVVGHSNTLSELVRLFGGQPGPEIADNEYDRVYQLVYRLVYQPASGPDAVTTVLFTSLPPTGPAP